MPRERSARGALARTFRRYLNEPGLAPGSAAAVLRGAYLATFAGQIVVALLVALVVALAAGRQAAPSAAVAIVAVAASTGQLLLGIAITVLGVRSVRVALRTASRPDARRAVLSHSLLSAVVLSTPAWLAAFAWLTGQSLTVLAAIASLALMGYGFGFLQLGSLARSVATASHAGHADADPGSAPPPDG